MPQYPEWGRGREQYGLRQHMAQQAKIRLPGVTLERRSEKMPRIGTAFPPLAFASMEEAGGRRCGG